METTNPDIIHAYETLLELIKQQNEIVSKLDMDLSTASMLSDSDKKQLSILIDMAAYESKMSIDAILKVRKKVKSLVKPIVNQGPERTPRR